MKREALTATAVAIVAIVAAHPARAMPVSAHGSFTIVPAIGAGTTTVNTGNITLGTSSKTDPDMIVQASAPNLNLAIHPGDSAVFSSHTRVVPVGVGTAVPVNFDLTVGGIEFDFDTGRTNARTALNLALGAAGSISEQFSGALSVGNGVFATGTPVGLSESCTQAVQNGRAGLISCTSSVVTIGPVPEPASLAILGAALLGLGVIWRRRSSDLAQDERTLTR